MRKLETTTDLLDALQERLGCDSDNQVAQRMGIPQQSVSNWRSGRTYPTEVHALKIAKALEMDPLHVLAIAAADRSPDEKTKKEWLRQIARLIAALALLNGAPSGSYAPTVDTTDRGVGIMSHRKRKRAADPLAA